MASAKKLELLDNSGTALGELLDLKSRRTAIPLRGPRVSTFTVRDDHEFSADLLSLARLVRVTQANGVLLGILPLLAADEVAVNGVASIAVTAADPLTSRLQHRLIGKGVVAAGPGVSGIGKGIGFTMGNPLAPVDVGTIMRSIVDVTNAADGFTGVATSAGWVTASVSQAVGPWYFRPIAEVLLELSAPLGGPDFWLRPVEPADIGFGAAKPKIAELVIAPFKGQLRDDVIFEYGCGKHNVTGYTRTRTAADLCNRAYTLPAGFPDSAAQTNPGSGSPVTGDTYQTVIANGFDAAQSITDWGVHEHVVSTDLGVDQFRQILADEHVKIRRNPREQITFTLARNSEYTYGTDFVEGDIVTARAKRNGVMRFDGLFRLYNVAIGDDEQGNEQLELTVTPS